ncbi:hypothetical protein LCGC14_1609940 [marine sediment metagenome]|uniref:Uncharacterized protein n=1 Tax=marine sediment metagenome TaxID=412755 RepID=A0A0F9I8W5_9ZZZZ
MEVLKRHYFECENGARWSECEWDSHESPYSKDGDWCNVSGCKENDHKIKLVKTDDNHHKSKYRWFRRPIK